MNNKTNPSGRAYLRKVILLHRAELVTRRCLKLQSNKETADAAKKIRRANNAYLRNFRPPARR